MIERFYEVFGCDTGGTWDKRGCIFSSKANACKYAVANKGKIAYGMPLVEMHITEFNDDLTVAYTVSFKISEEEIIKCSMRGEVK